MTTIERLLGAGEEPGVPYILRPLQTGDIGWVIRRQGMLYAEEYGWDETFEAMVAEIAAAFVKSFDPRQEGCWIAERDGEIVGSVFLVRESDAVAKLRLLYVEPLGQGPRNRPPARRGMHPLRQGEELRNADALDQRHPRLGAADL